MIVHFVTERKRRGEGEEQSMYEIRRIFVCLSKSKSAGKEQKKGGKEKH